MQYPEISRDDKTAILVGAQGFVGQHVLTQLVKHKAYEQVKVISEIAIHDLPEKVEQIPIAIKDIDLSTWSADDLFLCYDSSFFNAGGKYAIPSSTYRYLPRMISSAKEVVGQIILLSSKSAHKDAILSRHRIRGIIEDIVVGQAFWGTHIFKPSIILGETLPEKWGEDISSRISSKIDKYTGGWLRRNQPIAAQIVAQAMIEMAQKTKPGLYYYHSDWLQDYESAQQSTDLRK